MKKLLILLCLVCVGLLSLNILIVFGASPKNCTVMNAINHENGCDKVCDVLKNKDDFKGSTPVPAKYCGSCKGDDKGAFTDSNGNKYYMLSFEQMYRNCCMDRHPNTCNIFTIQFCDYSKNRYFGTCSKSLSTKGASDSNGCKLWYLEPIYQIIDKPLFKDSGALMSKIGVADHFFIWEPFILSNSSSNKIRPIEQESENYNATLEAFLVSNGLQTCTSDKDCIRCPIDDPECNFCPDGQHKPHYACDSNTYQCVLKYSCGVDQCNYLIKVDGKQYIKECCKLGEKFPHTECVKETISCTNGKLVDSVFCKEVASCGKDQCSLDKNADRKDIKFTCIDKETQIVRKVLENDVCIALVSTTSSTTTTNPEEDGTSTTSKPSDGGNRYVCNPNSIKVDGYEQCFLDNSNKYPNAKSCDTKNNKFKVEPVECKLKSQYNQTCFMTLVYNTDCSSIKPTSTTKSEPKVQNACYISTFGFYYKTENRWVDTLSLFSKPDKGILDKPKLEYTAIECNTCELSIEPSIPNFISKNPNIFGKLTGELIKGFSNRYVFDRSSFNGESIILDVNELTPGSYTLTLDCTDPVLKEHQIKSVKLNIFPQLRWREVVPIIN